MKQVLEEYNWRDGALQVIAKRKEQLEKIIKIKEASIQEPCEGKIRVLKRKNSYQYFLRTDPKDTNGKYLTLDKRHIAAGISQQEYDKKVIDAAQNELKIADEYLDMLRHNNVSTVYESMNPGKQIFVTPVFIQDEQYVALWQSKQYEPMPITDDIEFISNGGVRVRSKSELIIANILEQQKIPYRYEYPVILGGFGQVRPDFTCLNTRTRQEFIWEHFGMMDNISYANKNVIKINTYEQNGFYQGKNMIMTFETSQHPISSTIIKTMIKQYLI